MHRQLQGTKIDSLVGIVILVNSLTIGMQMEAELNGRDTSFYQRLEIVYVCVCSNSGLERILSNFERFF